MVKKRYAYEESIRVPLYITAPEYRTSQSSSWLVINNDLAPTILDLAEAQADIIMDGRSLVPLLSNPKEENWRDKFFVEQWQKEDNRPLTYSMIRTNSHVFTIFSDFTMEFYDLEKDPYQLHNQIDCTTAACKEKIIEHLEWLKELKDCGNGMCQILENKQ